MNVYLWSTELDNVALQSTWLDAIHLGTDEVWSAAPSTKRLLLYVETDLVPSSDWEWEDYNGQEISYVDMPVDYKAIMLTWNDNSYDFIPLDSNWNPVSYTEKFRAYIDWRQWWVNFIGIKYVPYGWTEFDVDLTTTRNQAIPNDETWVALQDWDVMVIVFETQTGPSIFTHSSCNSVWSNIYNNLNTLMWGSATRYNYRILGNDWYWYILWYPGSWGSNQRLYWIKLDSTWAIVTYTTDPVPSQFTQSWMPDYFNGTDESTNMFVTISNALWIQISNTQEFWMCIYNHLQ